MLAFATLMVVASGLSGQEQDAARLAYFRAVASYFGLPATEITILGDWELPPDEIPVVLFVASRAGVSPEALLALRTSGRSWGELTRRYGIGASALHLPLSQGAFAGPLASTYDRFRATPVAEWGSINLTDPEIVTLVNVRVLSESLDMSPGEILGSVGASPTFVHLYQRLIR